MDILVKCLMTFKQDTEGTREQWQTRVLSCLDPGVDLSFVFHRLCPATSLDWFFSL